MMDNPELIPIQTEQGEMIAHLDGTISGVNATKRHRSMSDEEVTDIVPEGTYIASRDPKMKITKKEASLLPLGQEPIFYEEGKKPGVSIKTYTVGDLFRGKEKKLTPSQLVSRVKNKFPMSKNDDMYARESDKHNKQLRQTYLQGIKHLNELKKMQQGVGEYAPPSFAYGGTALYSQMIPKAQTGMIARKAFQVAKSGKMDDIIKYLEDLDEIARMKNPQRNMETIEELSDAMDYLRTRGVRLIQESNIPKKTREKFDKLVGPGQWDNPFTPDAEYMFKYNIRGDYMQPQGKLDWGRYSEQDPTMGSIMTPEEKQAILDFLQDKTSSSKPFNDDLPFAYGGVPKAQWGLPSDYDRYNSQYYIPDTTYVDDLYGMYKEPHVKWPEIFPEDPSVRMWNEDVYGPNQIASDYERYQRGAEFKRPGQVYGNLSKYPEVRSDLYSNYGVDNVFDLRKKVKRQDADILGEFQGNVSSRASDAQTAGNAVLNIYDYLIKKDQKRMGGVPKAQYGIPSTQYYLQQRAMQVPDPGINWPAMWQMPSTLDNMPQKETDTEDALSPFDSWIKSELNYQAPELPASASWFPQLTNMTLGAINQLGIYGQNPVYTPFTPNPTDVNQAFKGLDKENLLNTTRNYAAGRSRSLAEYMQRAGAEPMQISSGLAGYNAQTNRQIGQQAQAIDTFNLNQDQARGRFNMQIDQGRNQAEEMTRMERNKQLAESTMGAKQTGAQSYNLWREYQELKNMREVMAQQRRSQAAQFANMRDFLREMYS